MIIDFNIGTLKPSLNFLLSSQVLIFTAHLHLNQPFSSVMERIKVKLLLLCYISKEESKLMYTKDLYKMAF